MTSLKRQNKVLLVKVLALLSIVRWLNILLTIVAQYLAAIFVLTPHQTYQTVLSNPKLHLMTLASAFIIASGYLINNFYDFEKDLVNRPEKTLLGRVVSRKFGLNCYFLFNFIGLGIALLASWRIFLFYCGFAVLLWAYSHKFQKIRFIREITASILSVTSFFAIGIFYKFITIPLFVYGMYAMLIIFSREILKGIEAYRGNAIFGYGTMATWLGKQKSALAIIIIQFISTIPLLILWKWYGMIYLSGLLLVTTISLIPLNIRFLYFQKTQKEAETMHTIYKIVLVLIIFLVVFIQENLS